MCGTGSSGCRRYLPGGLWPAAHARAWTRERFLGLFCIGMICRGRHGVMQSLCLGCGCDLDCCVRYIAVLLLCPHLSMLSTLHLLPSLVCALRVVDSGQRGRLYIIIPLPAFYRPASLMSVRYACCLRLSLNDDQHGCLYITVTAIRLLPCCLVLHTCCVRCV